jgi:HD-GYP domain-containing protein (c-di-GMP phosphodiesterase class II)
LIALRLKLPLKEVLKVMIAGALHDVGKFKLKSNVLFKADELTSKEFDYLKGHAELGASQLMKFWLSGSICEMVLQHHENADGTGYPYGISINDISQGARIIRVADVYSALTVDRVYHDKISGREAISLMLDEADCYDFEILHALIEISRKRHGSLRLSNKREVSDKI